MSAECRSRAAPENNKRTDTIIRTRKGSTQWPCAKKEEQQNHPFAQDPIVVDLVRKRRGKGSERVFSLARTREMPPLHRRYVACDDDMTRTVARGIAVQLGFGITQSGADAAKALDDFFEKEYYETLSGESELFEQYPDEKQLEYIRTVVTGTLERKDELDGIIEQYSKGWKLSRISLIAATILRTALFEVIYMDDVPDSVAINEAVELAKGYEEPETVSFINGILGSFMRAEHGSVEGESPDNAPETEQ